MIDVDAKSVLLLHDFVVELTGGKIGVRGKGLLDSAIACAYQTFDGVELFPSIEEKAARIGFGVMRNHAFFDGNKRVGGLIMMAFLKLNNVNIAFSHGDLVKLEYEVACSNKNYGDVLNWINSHKQKEAEKDN